jgi:predicted phosphodiesterase
MRIGVIADIHANLPALRAVIEDLASIGCDAVWCAGDVVGRGPHPNEVVAELRGLAIPTVQGNWDEALGMGREVTGAIWASPEAEAEGYASLAWTASRISEENAPWLRPLPATMRMEVDGRTALVFHGSPMKQNEYLWEDRPSRYFARIASDEGHDIFAFGHTHQTFHRVTAAAHFIGAGSVGCGGVGDARARYAVLYVSDTDVVVGFRSVEYDRDSVARDMAAAGLPLSLLREPPVPHPQVDPGIMGLQPAEAPAQA